MCIVVYFFFATFFSCCSISGNLFCASHGSFLQVLSRPRLISWVDTTQPSQSRQLLGQIL